jgi:hypothetical protein
LQEFVDKYNTKVKALEEIRDKISEVTLVSDYNKMNNP